MTARRRRRRGGDGTATNGQASLPSLSQWRTLPVYAALAFGLFFGWTARILFEVHPNSRWENIVNLAFAALFAFALSQLATRSITQMMLRRKAGPSQTGRGPRPGG
jgi:hypothetical protein